jgi:hypothetical protein
MDARTCKFVRLLLVLPKFGLRITWLAVELDLLRRGRERHVERLCRMTPKLPPFLPAIGTWRYQRRSCNRNVTVTCGKKFCDTKGQAAALPSAANECTSFHSQSLPTTHS